MRWLATLLLSICWACTSKPTETAPDTGAAPATPKKPIDPAQTSTVSGTIRFEGTPPAPTMVNASSDGACLKMRPGTFDAGDVQVKGKKVENAFVWISSGVEEYAFDPPKGEVTIDQKGCMYQPRIAGARADQTIVFTNSDETIHNIKSSPKKSKGWNFVTPPRGSGGRSLSKQEVMVRVGCDVHPWMTAWLGIVEHPLFAVTDAEGRFRLEGVPFGKHKLSVWHERLGSAETEITVAPDTAAVELALPGPT